MILRIFDYFSWNTKDIKSQGRMSIDSAGHKNLKITFGLGGSHFDSKGGVVGGSVDLQNINTHCKFNVKLVLMGKDIFSGERSLLVHYLPFLL